MRAASLLGSHRTYVNSALHATESRIMQAATSAHASLPSPKDFASAADNFSVAILGDLHLPTSAAEMGIFHRARAQLVDMLGQYPSTTARVVQLGDLGSYERGWPGSAECFARSREYLDGFGLPAALVLGNHDLEGEEFEADEANLAAWHAAFEQRHFWSVDVGPATFVGLSTTRFRSNAFSAHEVHVDEEQMRFFEETLQAAGHRPVVVFTHAPVMGSGLKVVQAVHVKNRCAWLNHSSDPRRFMKLVQAHPNIKLWFSGHFHLSQSYPDSISVVGGTAFVLTGVIGAHASRDGHSHSRLLKGSAAGFELYTVDHDADSARLDLRGRWDDPGPPQYLVPQEELLCDPSTGWLCSPVDCALVDDDEPCSVPRPPPSTWLNAGPEAMLLHQEELVIEYDVRSMSAVGAVCLGVPDGAAVRLVDAAGDEVDGVHGDGSAAVAVEVADPESGVVLQRVPRNEQGSFYQIFQSNKWRARKAKEAEAARAAARAEAAAKKAVA